MNSLINRHKLSFGALASAALFLIVSLILIISNVTYADDNNVSGKGRLMTIYDRDSKRVILTESLTVGDALQEAGISIETKDVVEPVITEKLVASEYQVNIYRARPVVVVDGNIRQKIITAYQTAEQIASDAGITIYPEDETELGLSSDLSSGAGLQLTINRAIPFNFMLYGKVAAARTQGETVGDMLTEKGIELAKDDRVTPSQDTPITENMKVRVWREGKQTITVDESVDFEVDTIENADWSVGQVEIKTPGVKGSRSVTYEILIQDGKEVSRTEIASLVIKQPVKQVETVGVKGQYTTPSENENITWDFLINNGFSRIQAAGIMGNLMQEHGFNTSGDGIAQWTGGRRAQLYSLPYPNNIYTQLNFLMSEFNGGYAPVRDAIKASSSLTEAVQIFQNRFEKCGICMESKRITYAQNILASH